MNRTVSPDGDATGTERRGTEPGSIGIDTADPDVEEARLAERRAYDHYGVEYAERWVDVDDLGVRMRVLEVGTGPPIVLITGATGIGLEWLPLLPELPGHTCYVVDRPGGGLSDPIDHRTVPPVRQAVVATEALYDAFGLESAPIVANSIGGNWALRFEAARPGRVPAIALLGCPAFFPGTSAPLPMRLASLPGLGPVIYERFIRPADAGDSRGNWAFLGQSPETVSGLPESYAEAWFRMQTLPNARLAWVSFLRTWARLRGGRPAVTLEPADLGAVEAPVLLGWGRADPFGSVEAGRGGASLLRDAEFRVVGEGHLPWLDAPADCGDLVREFLTRRV